MHKIYYIFGHLYSKKLRIIRIALYFSNKFSSLGYSRRNELIFYNVFNALQTNKKPLLIKMSRVPTTGHFVIEMIYAHCKRYLQRMKKRIRIVKTFFVFFSFFRRCIGWILIRKNILFAYLDRNEKNILYWCI